MYKKDSNVEKSFINGTDNYHHHQPIKLDGPAVSALQRAIAEVKQRWSVIGWMIKN
jgi:hypothetical protein